MKCAEGLAYRRQAGSQRFVMDKKVLAAEWYLSLTW